MLPIIWEHISIFYIISVFVASICLVLTYFYSHGLDEPIVEEEDLKKNKPEDFLAERKPLRLAKKLEEKLPESVKNLEKKVEEEQVEAIYKLMQEHAEAFGGTTMEDMKTQMKLYGF